MHFARMRWTRWQFQTSWLQYSLSDVWLCIKSCQKRPSFENLDIQVAILENSCIYDAAAKVSAYILHFCTELHISEAQIPDLTLSPLTFKLSHQFKYPLKTKCSRLSCDLERGHPFKRWRQLRHQCLCITVNVKRTQQRFWQQNQQQWRLQLCQYVDYVGFWHLFDCQWMHSSHNRPVIIAKHKLELLVNAAQLP